jgi:solute carrier family 29 (equilibrative nucleoside transporter), member 4
MRFLLIPLLLFCAAPRHRPLIPGDGLPIFFSGLLGLTNGVIGSVPMILAPSKVPEEFRELTGTAKYLTLLHDLKNNTVCRMCVQIRRAQG